jgi:hypothetical protein
MSTTFQVDRDERRYIDLAVVATDEDNAAVDPTGDTVEVAARAVRDESDRAWEAATWVTATVGGATVYYARILYGVAPWDLAPALYRVWVKVTDSPEIPILGEPPNEIYLHVV